MSFIDNEEAQAAMIAYLKGVSTITAELPSADEIREFRYQGTEFSYPNVRVRMIDNVPVGNSGCFHRVTIGIQVNSELDSSIEASHISGIIAQRLNGTSFQQNNLTFALRVTNILPALRADERTWRSELLITAIVS